MKALFFNSQSKNITSAALLLAISSLISKLLGLVRDRLLAGRFGAGPELDVYFLAFRIPDLIYAILITGGISAAFLPVFADYFQKDKKEGWVLSNVVLNFFLVSLIVLSGILVIFTPQLIKLIAPGFSFTQQSLAVSLTRIMFLSPIFFGLSSIFSGILHYFNLFFVYSLAPILYNLGIILGIIFFAPNFGVKGLVYGVILGAFLHCLIQIPAAWMSGFRYKPIFNFHHPGLKKIFKMMSWRVIGTSIDQINLIFITALSSTLAVGSITIFNFSNNLSNVATGIIGLSFAISAFPSFSRAQADGSQEKLSKDFSLTVSQILFLVIPISLLMFLLKTEIVQIILAIGQFSELDIALTSACLGAFCFGIFALSLTPLLLRLFFSLQEVKIPTMIGFIYVGLTIINSYLFVWLLGFNNFFQGFIKKIFNLVYIENIQIVGLPLAISISAIIYFALLLAFLKKKIKWFKVKEIGDSLKRIIFANLIMLFVFYLFSFSPILAGLISILTYFLLTYFLDYPEAKSLFSVLKLSKQDESV